MAQQTEDPPDALAVLGNEVRMSILRELADADQPLPFSDLRERVDIRDTGRFNYHLTKLCEYFVRQTEGGYELGHAGTRLIAAVDPVTETVENSDKCPVCGDEECEKLYHVHLTGPWA